MANILQPCPYLMAYAAKQAGNYETITLFERVGK